LLGNRKRTIVPFEAVKFEGLNVNEPPGDTVTSIVVPAKPLPPPVADGVALELLEEEDVVRAALGTLYWGLASAMKGKRAVARMLDASIVNKGTSMPN